MKNLIGKILVLSSIISLSTVQAKDDSGSSKFKSSDRKVTSEEFKELIDTQIENIIITHCHGAQRDDYFKSNQFEKYDEKVCSGAKQARKSKIQNEKVKAVEYRLSVMCNDQYLSEISKNEKFKESSEYINCTSLPKVMTEHEELVHIIGSLSEVLDDAPNLLGGASNHRIEERDFNLDYELYDSSPESPRPAKSSGASKQ